MSGRTALPRPPADTQRPLTREGPVSGKPRRHPAGPRRPGPPLPAESLARSPPGRPGGWRTPDGYGDSPGPGPAAFGPPQSARTRAVRPPRAQRPAELRGRGTGARSRRSPWSCGRGRGSSEVAPGSRDVRRSSRAARQAARRPRAASRARPSRPHGHRTLRPTRSSRWPGRAAERRLDPRSQTAAAVTAPAADPSAPTATSSRTTTSGRAGDGRPAHACRFNDGSHAAATIVGRDPLTDLAVIQAEGVSGPHPGHLGNSSSLDVGERVVAIGSPFGLEAP